MSPAIGVCTDGTSFFKNGAAVTETNKFPTNV
jgi:hypothetical protein